MALNSLSCADVLLSNYTHPVGCTLALSVI